MALIKCPECGNNISDKAEACIHCGFPLKTYVGSTEIKNVVNEEMVEDIPRIEILTAYFEKDYVLTYDNGHFELKQDDNVIYSGDVSGVKVYGVKKSIFDFGTFELHIPQKIYPHDLKCKDDNSFDICSKIYENCKLRGCANDYETTTKEPVVEIKTCPKCGGTNFHAFVEDVVIRQGKTKTETSLNLNPLKMFTVFNHKEKVIREPKVAKVSKFVCDDCGKIFQ